MPHSRQLSEEEYFWRLRGALGWDNAPSDRLYYEKGNIIAKRDDEKYGECSHYWCPYESYEIFQFIERFDLYQHDVSQQVAYYLTAGEDKEMSIKKSYLDLVICIYEQDTTK